MTRRCEREFATAATAAAATAATHAARKKGLERLAGVVSPSYSRAFELYIFSRRFVRVAKWVVLIALNREGCSARAKRIYLVVLGIRLYGLHTRHAREHRDRDTGYCKVFLLGSRRFVHSFFRSCEQSFLRNRWFWTASARRFYLLFPLLRKCKSYTLPLLACLVANRVVIACNLKAYADASENRREVYDMGAWTRRTWKVFRNNANTSV